MGRHATVKQPGAIGADLPLPAQHVQPERGEVKAPDARRLCTYTWGSGTDVVVLEAGLGFSGRYWGPVARALARSGVRAVAYDRAGYGDSTPSADARDLQALSRDLLLVARAQRARRLVLVGHSWGGPIVRHAAIDLGASPLQHILLVDPSDEHVDAYFSRSARTSDKIQAKLLPALARLGLLRAVMTVMAARLPMSSPERRATVEASCSRDAVTAATRENRHVRDGLLHLRNQPAQYTVPTSILSGVKSPRGARKDLVEAHRAAAKAMGARLICADNSQHMVPLTEPEVVATEALRGLNMSQHNPSN